MLISRCPSTERNWGLLNYRMQVFLSQKLTHPIRPPVKHRANVNVKSEYSRESNWLSCLYALTKGRSNHPGIEGISWAGWQASGSRLPSFWPSSLLTRLRRPLFFPWPNALSSKTLLKSVTSSRKSLIGPLYSRHWRRRLDSSCRPLIYKLLEFKKITLSLQSLVLQMGIIP